MLARFRPDRFWLAVATLVGSTVGIGLYGLPFAFMKAGFGLGLLFLLGLTGLVLLVNLLYGEVVLRTHRRHQLVGYIHKYLGPWARRVNLFVFWVAVYGALIGIIIISGDFLTNLLSGWLSWPPALFSTVWLVLAAALVLAGLRTVARVDLAMLWLFGAVVAAIAVAGARQLQPAHYTLASVQFWFLPFGVVLFALNNSSGVPLVRELLVGRERDLRRAITLGTLIPAGLYLLFTLLVVGIAGENTTPDAVSGLQGYLGSGIVLLGSLFGFLTTTSIFLNLSTALRESLAEDFNFKSRWAYPLALLPPYLLFLSGIRNFIDIIALVGGVAVSVQTILLVLLYARVKSAGERLPEYSIRLPRLALYGLMLLFAAGAAYTMLVK